VPLVLLLVASQRLPFVLLTLAPLVILPLSPLVLLPLSPLRAQWEKKL